MSLLTITLADYCAAVGEKIINGETFFEKKILLLIVEPLQELEKWGQGSSQNKSLSMDRTGVRIKTYKPKPSHFFPEVDPRHSPGLFSTSLGFTSYPRSSRSVLILWDSLSFTRQTIRSTCIQKHSSTSGLSPSTVITAHQCRYRGSVTQQLV